MDEDGNLLQTGHNSSQSGMFASVPSLSWCLDQSSGYGLDGANMTVEDVTGYFH
jgi:hypothetical protein